MAAMQEIADWLAMTSISDDRKSEGAGTMIVVHHLNNSRSQRILWLLEELNTPYRVDTYRRDAKTNLAPSELRAVHPLGKSPVIQDGDLVLAEFGAIIEYLLERHGDGRLVPARGTNEHVRYLHWMHFAEGTIMLHLVARLYLGRVGDAAKTMQARVEGMIGDELDLVEAELTRDDHLAGAEFSAADVQMMFPLEFAAFVSKPAFSTNQIHACACIACRAHDGQRKRVAHMRTATTTAKAAADQNRLEITHSIAR